MGSAGTRDGWWWMVAFIGASFLFFWPTLAFSPFSDDHSALWNSGVRGIPWRNGFFRPLSDATFRLGDLLWGTSVAGHRAINLVIHGTNAFLLFTLMERWAGRRTALLSAVLFLLYPFHQESIVWLVGRESALGTSAVLLGLVIISSGPWNGLRAIMVASTLLLGSLCYESALLLIPTAFIVAWSRVVPGWPSWRKLFIPLLLPCIGYFLLRWVTTGIMVGGYFQELIPDTLARSLLNAPKALGRLFLPPEADPKHQLLRGALLGVLLAFGVLLIRRSSGSIPRRMLTLLGLLLFTAMSIAFVAGVSTATSESDRFLYLPSVFLCASIGLLLAAVQRPLVRSSVFACLVVACLWQLRGNHANWNTASRITRECLHELPGIDPDAHLWVSGLPDAYEGAFIFRNGFPEAVDLIGGEGDRIIVVPDRVSLEEVAQKGLFFRGAQRTWERKDRWFRWGGAGYSRIAVP
ncbi:MAG: hypothetical protein H6592_07075 [Flavobacteriales bacterium]|nr:hypothetical protein [Flavobacteriales bacterium]